MGENQPDCQENRGWTQYSESKLIAVETKILAVLKSKFKIWFVPIGSAVGNNDKIWTISLNDKSLNTPLVMIHGCAAGIGFWCMNFDELAKDRPVYAIDLLGFGRSSRPTFSKDCEIAEQQWVSAIEAWRKEVNLDKFILLGHSFGGYLATSYTINHPDRVKHLILADPWGFSEKSSSFRPKSIWVRILGTMLYPFTYLNPCASIRAVGPFGPWLVRIMRADVSAKYEGVLNDKELINEYMYHCNTQHPSGEAAFHSLYKGFGWPRHPMIQRYDHINENVPITILYGKESWISKQPGMVLQEKRIHSFVDIEIIPNAGHHLFSDQPKIFNKIVQETCKITEKCKNSHDMKNALQILKKRFDPKEMEKFIIEDYKGVGMKMKLWGQWSGEVA